jgi:serine protease
MRRTAVASAAAAVLAVSVGLAMTAPASAAATSTNVAAHTAAAAKPRPPQVKLTHRFIKAPAIHVRAGIVPQRNHAITLRGNAVPAAGSGNLLYNGGPVAHTSRLYLVFWGTQWSSDPNGVESYLYNYTHGICSSGDHWVSSTFQYTDSSGAGPTCNNGVAFQGWVQDASGPAPANASQAQIAAEAASFADYFGATGTDVQIAVISPSGTHPDGFPNTGFCAWHSYTNDSSGNFVAFTNMPYVLDAGSSCGANSVQGPLDGFSIVEGHEFAETVTDPALNAWYDSAGYENGDKCAWTSLFAQSTPSGTFAQQPLWDNSSSSCAA